MKQGIYYIYLNSGTEEWSIKPNMEGYEASLGEVIIEEYLNVKFYHIYLDAIDPISAFTRGCNLIRDKMEGV